MKEREKLRNAKRIGMAIGILLIVLSLFVIQIQAQLEKPTAVQGNSIDKSAADKVKEDPPKIVKASEASVSKEEQSLVDQLIKARKAGNTNEVQNIEGKIAAYHGKKLSYIKASDLKGGETTTATTAKAPGKDPCITCNTTNHGYLSSRTMVHDQYNNLYVAVNYYAALQGQVSGLYVYRSTDNGATWKLFWALGNQANQAINSPSLAIGGNYLFIAASVEPDISTSIVSVWKINTGNPSDYTRMDFGGSGSKYFAPKIVTDFTEWPNYWYVYMVYTDSSSNIIFTKSIDFGKSWITPTSIASAPTYNPTVYFRDSIDYGGGYLYIAWNEGCFTRGCYGSPRNISFISSSNYGNSWRSKVSLTSKDDSYEPTVAAVKSSSSNGNVVIAYTRNWANSGDLDVWYAYSKNHGATWTTNNCLACSGSSSEAMSDATTSDNLGYIQAVYVKNTGGGQGPVYGSYTGYYSPESLGKGVSLISASNRSEYPIITAKSSTAGVAWIDRSSVYGQVQFTSW
ncbi:MAG TPA: sialidase family protein [Bacteroidales bacterium]